MSSKLDFKWLKFTLITLVLSLAVGFSVFFYMFSLAEPLERTEFLSEMIFCFFWPPFLVVWAVYGIVRYVIKGFGSNKKEGYNRLRLVVSVAVWFLRAFLFLLLGGNNRFFLERLDGTGGSDTVTVLFFLILFSVLGGFLGLLFLKVIYWFMPKNSKWF